VSIRSVLIVNVPDSVAGFPPADALRQRRKRAIGGPSTRATCSLVIVINRFDINYRADSVPILADGVVSSKTAIVGDTVAVGVSVGIIVGRADGEGVGDEFS